MNQIELMLHNPMLVLPVISWFVAQVIKTAIHTFLNKEFVAERLVGGGGMPSSHSATVCALSTAAALRFGMGSFEFAMATVFSIVTMYDAMGVRRETGIQGKVINELVEAFTKMGNDVGPEKALKELVGHTPLQVLMGAILGVVLTILIYNTGIFA